MKKIRLNLGCAGRVLKNYINVDQDSIRVMKKRYPGIKLPKIKKFIIIIFLSYHLKMEQLMRLELMV